MPRFPSRDSGTGVLDKGPRGQCPRAGSPQGRCAALGRPLTPLSLHFPNQGGPCRLLPLGVYDSARSQLDGPSPQLRAWEQTHQPALVPFLAVGVQPPSCLPPQLCLRPITCPDLGFQLSLLSPGGTEVKASACHVGDLDSIPGSGRSPGEGNGNPLQYSCLENPMDGGAWWATVHRSQRVEHD